MNTLYLIRHGATAGNLERRYIGRTDEPLCPLGYARLKAWRGWILPVDRLFVSPMLRTRQTAEFLFPDLAFTVVDGFRETDFGLFEGKTGAELWEDPIYRAWVNGGCQGDIPSGEPSAQFKARCTAAFAAALETLSEGMSAGFVIHGGVIMAILERFAQPKRNFYDYRIDNGACIVCRYENGALRIVEGPF